MEKTDCYTYFKITGDFKSEDITKRLNIQPFKTFEKGELRKNKKRTLESRYTFSLWQTQECHKYHHHKYSEGEIYHDVNEQCLIVINELKDKIDILNKIKSDYDEVNFSLVVVMQIYNGNSPGTCFNKEVIGFCHAIGCEIDVDMYVYPFEEL